MMMVVMPIALFVRVVAIVAAAEMKPGIGRCAADQREGEYACCEKLHHKSFHKTGRRNLCCDLNLIMAGAGI